MLANLLFYVGLLVSFGIGFVYFRDLGDISQMVIKTKRENTVRFMKHEYKLIGVGLAATLAMIVGYAMGGGFGWLFWVALVATAFFFAFTWVWVHVGLRNQKDKAQYYPIEVARDYINPSASVMVVVNNGHARAHSDQQMMRPHLAGNDQGLDGEDVVIAEETPLARQQVVDRIRSAQLRQVGPRVLDVPGLQRIEEDLVGGVRHVVEARAPVSMGRTIVRSCPPTGSTSCSTRASRRGTDVGCR